MSDVSMMNVLHPVVHRYGNADAKHEFCRKLCGKGCGVFIRHLHESYVPAGIPKSGGIPKKENAKGRPCRELRSLSTVYAELDQVRLQEYTVDAPCMVYSWSRFQG